MCKSEVAQLRQQIELELDAMQRGLSGLASGTARHSFIHARMERIGSCQDRLAQQIGETAAHHIVCQLYVRAMDPDMAFEMTK
ncbi:MAG: hypothetical protein J2P37_18710 [Ktedonobacteraceae bacterium]|nr:hypothetical protein [Ktedonobacteraceae bacterium]MBO0790871.1 hypothetical protein [Ktedonobacteraceae bacterium]